jgi:hypothetical protein
MRVMFSAILAIFAWSGLQSFTTAGMDAHRARSSVVSAIVRSRLKPASRDRPLTSS